MKSTMGSWSSLVLCAVVWLHIGAVVAGGEDAAEGGALVCFQPTHPVDTPAGLAVEDRIIEPHHTLPACSSRLVRHSFANSYGKPFVGKYLPPPCSFDTVVLNLTVTSKGHQFDRLATLWLGDVEIWRTSTAEPTPDPGIVWYFLKDVTAYLPLWRAPQTVILDLGNIVDHTYTAPFDVTVEATFLQSSASDRRPDPPHAVLPISAKKSAQGSPSAFVFPSQKTEATLRLPRNSRRAVLTVAATGQASEEFWWSNVPEKAAAYYDSQENLPGLGSFREVRVYIDGKLAGLAWPFPVVFTGGIAPPLHRPMVGLGAFDLPEAEIDVTPWISVLSNGDQHTISIVVVGVDDTPTADPPVFTPARANWVLSAKVFVWLGEHDDGLTALAPPRVSVSDIDYTSLVTGQGDTGFDYKQAVTRRLEVSTDFHLPNGTPLRASWTQDFTMTNNGSMRDQGNYQQVRGIFHGSGISRHGSVTSLSTRFSYPISTTFHYAEDPQGSGGMEAEAVLSQQISLEMTRASPFATALEPLLDRASSPLIGSVLQASRDASATFRAGGGTAGGSGRATQHYRVSGMAPVDRGDNFPSTSRPRLYERWASVANGTVLEDYERLWSRGTDSRVATKAVTKVSGETAGERASEFAPPPTRSRFGGIGVFSKGDPPVIGEGVDDDDNRLPTQNNYQQQIA